jgi:hypothetical protein
MDNKELMQEVGKRWKAMSEAERKVSRRVLARNLLLEFGAFCVLICLLSGDTTAIHRGVSTRTGRIQKN